MLLQMGASSPTSSITMQIRQFNEKEFAPSSSGEEGGLNLEQKYSIISHSLLNSQLSRLQNKIAELEKELDNERKSRQKLVSDLLNCVFIRENNV